MNSMMSGMMAGLNGKTGDEFDKAQGLLPLGKLNRDPVKV